MMRIVDRIATLLLGVALLVGGLLLVLEAARVGFHRPPLLVDRDAWYAALAGARLNDVLVRVVLCAAAVLGVLIVASQVRRWRPRRLDVRLEPGRWHLHRRSVERQLSRTVAGLPGVRSADVRVVGRGDADGWRPRIRVVSEPPVVDSATAAARRELDQIGAPANGARADVVRRQQ